MQQDPSTFTAPESRQKRQKPAWINWSDEKLLDMRICDLDINIQGTQVERRISWLHRELDELKFKFHPHYWLGDDWYTPDGVPGFSIPFYLAHPRLAQLELKQMLEVEGGTKAECMRILRHEVGHAIDNAYLLRKRRHRQALFGRSSMPYPDYYTPKPYSKNFVLHLDSWYAQSHPDEDFAETFAVWFTPNSIWKRRYAGWPALKKLRYMDKLMLEIVNKDPIETTHRIVDPVHRIRRTLRQHYKRKRKHYEIGYPNFYDRDLRRIFSDALEFEKNILATNFLKKIRREVRRDVATWTSAYQYTIDQVLEDIIIRCHELGLRLTMTEERTKIEFAMLVTVQTMNYLHSSGHRLAL